MKVKSKYIPQYVWEQSDGWKDWFAENREPDTKSSRVLIAGVGRAGTSLLMTLLTRLGYDTGAEPYKEPINKKKRAGFEILLVDGMGNFNKEILYRSPEIIKAPSLSVFTDELFLQKYVPIRHVICPVREIRETAISRERVGLFYLAEHKDMSLEERIPNLFAVLGKVLESCTLYDVPLTTIDFPRLVKDKKYLYNKLKEVFPNMSFVRFSRVFDETVKISTIKTRINKKNYE